MIVWVVKVFNYEINHVDIYGVYSNLGLAGHAISMILDDARMGGEILTFTRFEEPWGYFFQIYRIESGKTQIAEIEIGRVTLDE